MGAMTQRSEQLVLDYLSEVGLELHGRLTARERTLFLADVRSRIDARRAAAGRDDPATVRDILLGLGTPRDLVEREVTGRDLDLEDEELLPPRPRQADRPPPPWRGGPPAGGLASLLEGSRSKGAGTRTARRGGSLRGVAAVVRRHPAEAAALLLLLAAVPWGWGLSFLWVLGTVLVLLSPVWSAGDKRIAVLVPVLGCLAGMALWEGEADFVDEYVQQSLAATGVAGLGLGSLVCVLHLYLRLGRA